MTTAEVELQDRFVQQRRTTSSGSSQGRVHSVDCLTDKTLRRIAAARSMSLVQLDGLKANRSPFESPTATIVPAIAGELKTAECAS